MFVPDPHKVKNVALPVRIVKGRVTFFYSKGGKMPALQDGAIGELVLPEYAVLDGTVKQAIAEEREVRLLESGEPVLLGYNGNLIEAEYRERTQKWDDTLPMVAGLTCLVQVFMTEPLSLLLRGTKKAQLRGGACKIPALDGAEAGSLNQAYTLISQQFQPSRRSHTGNVFRVAFCRDRDEDGCERWRRLDDLRDRHVAEYEQEVLLRATVSEGRSPRQASKASEGQTKLEF